MSIIGKISGSKGAQYYHIARNPKSGFHYDKYKKIFEILKKNRKWKVFELGCGSGIYTKFLAKDFDHVIASDIDPQMIEIARKEVKCDYVVADATDIPLKDNTMDMVFGVSIIHHVKNRDRMFKEIRRVLKPNGYLVFCEPNKLNPMTSVFQMLQKEDAISRFEARKFMKKYGFKIIAIKEILFRNPFSEGKSGNKIIEKAAEKLHMGMTLLMIGQKVG